MKNNDKIYNKLKKKYTDEEIAESFIFPSDITHDEIEKISKIIKESKTNINMKVTSAMFGDELEYPVITSIVNILNDIGNDNFTKYCVSTIQELRVNFKSINNLKDTKIYLMGLIKKDFIKRLDYSTINNKLKSHICNLITAIHNKNKLT